MRRAFLSYATGYESNVIFLEDAMPNLRSTVAQEFFPRLQREPVPLRTISLDAELVRLAGDGNTALFLRQVLFWHGLHPRPFYKFNAPAPDHPAYRPGDSWTEELGLTRSQFETARKRLAVKVAGKDPAQREAAFARGALMVYWTTEEHLTWYWLNEDRLGELAPEIYDRFLGVEEEQADIAPRLSPPASQADANPALRASKRASGVPRRVAVQEPWTKSDKAEAAGTRSASVLPACASPHLAERPAPSAHLAVPEASLETPILTSQPTPTRALVPDLAQRATTGQDGSASQIGPARFLPTTPRPDAAFLRPDAGIQHSRCSLPALPDAGIQHLLMRESSIGIIRNKAEKTLQRQQPDITFQKPSSLPPAAPAREGREEGGQSASPRFEQVEIQQALEERGVFADSAREIATRAVRQGLGVEAVIELFEAQVRQAEREQARNPLGAAVWRLQHQPLHLPRRAGRGGGRTDTIRDFLTDPLSERGTVEWRSDQEDVPEGEMLAPPAAEELPLTLDAEYHRLWRTVLDDLRLQMTRATFEQWLKDTRLERVEEDVFVVSTPNPYAPELLENRLGRLIRQTLQRQMGEEANVRYIVR
ncbi:MAG: hypothetical protein H0T73_00510 [Ardenticatenales bacterium]|nr:hypothetical protein [Ardenticatenales bacterium]